MLRTRRVSANSRAQGKTYARENHPRQEVIDICSEHEKLMHVSSHAVIKETCTNHKQKDPPIEPDRPPPDDKIAHQSKEVTVITNEQNINSNILSTEQLEQTGNALKEDNRSNDVPTRQGQLSKQKKHHVLQDCILTATCDQNNLQQKILDKKETRCCSRIQKRSAMHLKHRLFRLLSPQNDKKA